MDIENFGLNPFPCHPISTKMDNDTEGTDITYINILSIHCQPLDLQINYIQFSVWNFFQIYIIKMHASKASQPQQCFVALPDFKTSLMLRHMMSSTSSKVAISET